MARKVAKKTTAKRAASKKKATRKSTAKRGAAKKKTATKKKAATKKKVAAKKKPVAKKRAAAKKPVAKKRAAAKKAAPKKAAPKKVAAKPAKPEVQKAKAATKPKNGSTLSYTQSEFIENIQAFCGIEKKKEAKELWEDIQRFLQDSLKRGYRVPLVGLGKMYVRKSKARMGRNPATGEPIKIKAKKRVRFTPAKALKDAVL